MEALEDLKKNGLQKLILDLRGNGGGILDEAVEIADEFLEGDKLITYTEGKHVEKKEYRCRRNGQFENGPLIVLADEGTASASEILIGALQDWDRATIIGRRSFGKGLVQQMFDLDDGSALRLTIARYYTPLGRSIQRPYNKGKKIYYDEIVERISNGQALYADSNKITNEQKFRTNKGKIVYGGGGIMPDIFVPIDTSSYPPGIRDLLRNGGFNSFVYRYYLQHKKDIDAFRLPGDFNRQFNKEGDMWQQFINYASGDSINVNTISSKQKESLQELLKASLARFRWRSNGFYQVLNNDDSAVLIALEEMEK